MDIHYFQRYHGKENVSTGNAMLLLSRLYHYAPYKFYNFTRKLVGEVYNEFNGEISFKSQTKNGTSVPDGQIKQPSFNIVIETKLGKTFDLAQIKNHLKSFAHEDYQIMLTLGPQLLSDKQKKEVGEIVSLENQDTKQRIQHVHLTFEGLISLVEDEIDGVRDFEMADILEDYKEYCAYEKLLINKENRMRAVAVGATFEENMTYNLYYDTATQGYTEHGYIGLYKDKEIKAVGKITNIIEADVIEGKIEIKNETTITPQQTADILGVVKARLKLGNSIEKGETFFCVEKFYETSYKKTSPSGIMGKKFFNIKKITEQEIKSAEALAKALDGKTWE